MACVLKEPVMTDAPPETCSGAQNITHHQSARAAIATSNTRVDISRFK